MINNKDVNKSVMNSDLTSFLPLTKSLLDRKRAKDRSEMGKETLFIKDVEGTYGVSALIRFIYSKFYNS